MLQYQTGALNMRPSRAWMIAAMTTLVTGIPAAGAVRETAACLAADNYHQASDAYELCAAALKQAWLADKVRAALMIQRGEAAYFAGRMDLAIDDLNAALGLDPANGKGLLRRAWTYWHLMNFRGAINDLTALLEREPDNASAIFAMGFMHSDTQEPQKKVLPSYQRALVLEPRNHLIRYNIGLAYWTFQARPDLAAAEFHKILQAPADELRDVRIWREPGKPQYDFSGQVRYDLARARMSFESGIDVLADLNALIAAFPQVADSYILRSIYFDWKGDWSRSYADAELALAIQPRDGDTQNMALRGLYKLKRYNEGLKLADELLDGTVPQAAQGPIYFWRGFINKQLGNKDDALHDLETSFALDPTRLMAGITQLRQTGYYNGSVKDSYSPALQNAFMACIVDPACPK
jgi:tetratricopeptide (TPR) repeat protein